MPELSISPVPSARLASLDQFRGYTVLGMFVVNFVGSFAVVEQWLPLLKHHHTYVSYADTIMPQFFFAVGFAYRMTFLRRVQTDGPAAAYGHAIRRIMALLVVALIVHGLGSVPAAWSQFEEIGFWRAIAPGLKRNFFQTLTHIAVTSLWIMPVIAARPTTRVLFAVASAAAFHGMSESWYYEWVNASPKGIDGGPLGFLTWTIPMIVGTLAYDSMAHRATQSPSTNSLRSDLATVSKLLGWGAAIMLVSYAISCANRFTPPNHISPEAGWQTALIEPPFVPPSRPVNVWTMSQRSGSVSYLTFGAGFSLAVYAFFVWACDIGPLSLGVFRTLGTNALAAYILHDLVAAAIHPLVPHDSPLWVVALALALFLGICYAMLRYMERHRLFLKL
jgi:predicted acyltransferase